MICLLFKYVLYCYNEINCIWILYLEIYLEIIIFKKNKIKIKSIL